MKQYMSGLTKEQYEMVYKETRERNYMKQYMSGLPMEPYERTCI